MNEQNSESLGKRVLRRVAYGLGLNRNPPYVEERLRDADVRSAGSLTFVVAWIEVWMLTRYTIKYGSMCETVGEFLHYTYGYWILLLSSVAVFVYSRLYVRGKLQAVRKYSQWFIFLYFLVGLYFGATTSMSDFSRGRMIICFLSTLMYGTVIVIKRPCISVLLTVLPAYIFAYILNHYCYDKNGAQVVLSSGDTINFITFIISLLILEFTVYFQRYREAWEAYRLEKAAVTDDLTGIHNMFKFEQEARDYQSRCLEEGRQPVYLLLDIEHFQTFNDHFDYAGGDKLLIAMAHMVRAAFPDEPTARSSQDHFTVLTCAEDYAERLVGLREKIRADWPSETYLDLKAGAFRARNTAVNPRNAIDRAGYALKKIHNDERRFLIEYDEAMEKEYSLRQYVLNNLEKAVREDSIQVYYQPVVWASDETLSGCEALVRWIDPKMGFMNPGLFIPALEEGRQIHKLDLCVYEQVCKRIRSSLDQGLPVLPTSLNFSRLDFELMDVVGELEKLVQKYRVPKELLHVEITESAATEDVKGLKAAMDRLHGLGYSIWLDDFGSGYSSMNVLKDFDFDVLKIDMEFLRNFHGNENSRKIISGVINLAKALNMRTLCEGVETEEAVRFLQEAGCERLQGYYYSKPLPYEGLREAIQSGKLRLREGQTPA